MSEACRVCGCRRTRVLLDFGQQPNSLLLLPRPDTPHGLHPLRISVCPECDFVFIADPMPPEAFYGDVQLVTSLFPVGHLDALAEEVVGRLGAANDPLVFEIGCNDGAFLKCLRQAGLRRLDGLEPAARCADLARAQGLAVETGYFDGAAARAYVARRGRPDLVVCRHVLEHVTSLDDFVEGLAWLLGEGGSLLLELPDLAAIETRGDVSAIWEQHVNYFDLPVLSRLLARFGLMVTESRALDYGGGTLLTFVTPGDAFTPAPLRGREGLGRSLLATIADFHAAVTALHASGARIAAFGAGMRGAMLINLTGVAGMLGYVADDNPDKIGRYLSGSRLPIRAAAALESDRPDVLIVLPMKVKALEWAIMQRFGEFARDGGKFLEVLPMEGGAARLCRSGTPAA